MSTPLVVTIPHQLGRAEAKDRLHRNLGSFRSQLAGFGASVEDHWVEDRLEFRVGILAQTVTGRIDVREEDVRVEIDLPWLLKKLAEKISGRIEQRGRLLLTKR